MGKWGLYLEHLIERGVFVDYFLGVWVFGFFRGCLGKSSADAFFLIKNRHSL